MEILLSAVSFGQNDAGGFGIPMIIFWVAIIAIFYFLLIRPQQKQQKEHRKLIKELEVGDHIVTIGGFRGVITSVTDKSFHVKLAPEVEVEVIKSAVGRRDPDHGQEDSLDK